MDSGKDNAGKRELPGKPERRASGLQARIRGFRNTTQYQIRGEEYLEGRQRQALTRRDTRWIDDTDRHQSMPFWVGLAAGVVVVLGCLVASLIFPPGKVDKAQIVFDTESGTTYVKIGNAFSPTNLTSARLIVGSPEKPVQAKTSEINKFSRGPAVGIPEAPDVRNSDSRDSKWAVCDTAATGSAVPLDPTTGLPTTATSDVKVTVIGGALTDNPGTEKISGDRGRVMSYLNQTWLLYEQNGQVWRALIDLKDSTVTDALGIDPKTPVTPMSAGLFNAIDSRQPIAAPSILELGRPVRFANTEQLKIGTTLRTSTVDGGWTYYVATADGVQQISVPAAAILQPLSPEKSGVMEASADKVAQWPKVTGRIAVDHFPTGKIKTVDTASTPVTCFAWERNGTDPAATRSVFAARSLPLTGTQSPISLISARGSQGTVADSAYIAPGGRFVQVTGSAPDSKELGGTFWVADTGVRYGVDDLGSPEARGESAAALGLRNPVPVPWNILTLLAPGSTLSKQRALLKRDTVAPDPGVEAVVLPKPGQNAK